ncbi:hypothetical protein NIES3804_19180 [Microcystis aeruginosa NIES-3804]|uniref:Uncharacterized protein n=1 Tax=Microcystis aeruginosa NIES-3804 TaxID=2517783 RepID=A0A6H9G589_MICAE|nr:hypothetical protein [Microcystis aeruginosa]GCL50351.1 hypothetical protein NIES3804_19180 [Microcystis aeruginosa NIES-3804]
MMIFFKHFQKLTRYEFPTVLVQIVVIISCCATCANYQLNRDRNVNPPQLSTIRCDNEKSAASLSNHLLVSPLSSSNVNNNAATH